jgi:hypothetical protein
VLLFIPDGHTKEMPTTGSKEKCKATTTTVSLNTYSYFPSSRVLLYCNRKEITTGSSQ